MLTLPLKSRNMKTPTGIKITSTLVLIFILFFVGYIYSRHIDSPILRNSFSTTSKNTKSLIQRKESPKRLEIPLNCSNGNLTNTCPISYSGTLISSTKTVENSLPSTKTCPDYFRWIHEDLWPWRNTGITKEMVMRANRTANFRLVIVNGKAYLEMYEKAFQTRDTFTLWGILQLLRRYPGKLPDLDLMFDCVDWPVVSSSEYKQPNATAPPPVFRYCADDSTLDIVFPDWSFWGWPEINIKPWDTLLEELKEGNRKKKWIEREPYAYWKGNPEVAETRKDLLKCNVSDKQDWGARLYAQDWGHEIQKGFQQSNLADQCTHRYKIYIEGSAWSVSEKYILACDSLTLLVKPLYYDFFTRSLEPMKHYWPVKVDDKCRSIKFAVDWGNRHKQKVQDIGKASSDFVHKNLTMDFVYDYMFHLLNEYAKLLTYRPTIPPNSVELCSETMACPANGVEKNFMMASMVKYPSDSGPCIMPPPFDPPSFRSIRSKKEQSVRKVEMWENKFWSSQIK